MKFKLTWIPFIPLALVACFCKLAQGLMPEGALFGLSALTLDYIYMGLVALIFIAALILTLADRKMAPYYAPVRNIPAGILGVGLALTLAGDGADTLIRVFGAGQINVLNILNGVLSLLSAVVFVVLGFNHILNRKEGKRFVLMNAMPAILCAVRMILCFVQFTTISIRLADVSSLVCYIFATLFFFNYAVSLSLIKSKSALKNTVIFGFPAVAALLPYALYQLMFFFDTDNILSNIRPFEIFLMGLYIFAYLMEVTCFLRDKDSVRIIENEQPVEQEEVVENDVKAEDFITGTSAEDEADRSESSSYLTTQDTSDFLYQETPVTDDNVVTEAAERNMDGYLTKIEVETPDDRPKDYEKRLDEIDKLILEISEKSD